MSDNKFKEDTFGGSNSNARKETGFLLILPCLFSLIWLYLSIITNENTIYGLDFPAIYNSGKYIFTDPDKVYNYAVRYFYLPIIAFIFSFLALFSLETAELIFLIIILLFLWGTIIEFKKILELKGVNNFYIKLLFLMVISNGLVIMRIFELLQAKFIALFFLIIFIRRELENRIKNDKSHSIWFFCFQTFMLLLVIAIIPPFLFLLFFYILNDVKFRDLISKKQLNKYGLTGLIFLSQNFMFLVYPQLISGFISGINYNERICFSPNPFRNIWFIITINKYLELLNGISLIIMIISCFILIIKQLKIEQQFGYFSLISIFFNLYTDGPRFFVLLFPLIMVLFLDPIKSNDNDYNLFHSEWNHLIICCFSVLVIYFLPFNDEILFELFPIAQNIPIGIRFMRWTPFYLLIVLDLFLYLKKNPVRMI